MATTRAESATTSLDRDRSATVTHGDFTVSRRLTAPRAVAFSAFSDDDIRRRWIRLPGRGASYEHDFRVGGGEDARSTFVMPDGASERIRNRSRYLDIVPDQRIVFSYEAIVDDVVRWVSLVTVMFTDGIPAGSDVVWREQVAFLVQSGDGADLPHLRTGTALRLNGLAVALGVEGAVL
ncbi:SRPBCC domain-containing protein [Microbacterium sp. NPDC056234]|uniref:SRPBCC domain-containing protein n=1 Tax=Microbacterium sp. NPDC056234 TaxID=3345757 RepID=UPI0035DBCCED